MNKIRPKKLPRGTPLVTGDIPELTPLTVMY